MIDQETYQELKQEIESRTVSDRLLLDKLRADIRGLAAASKRIHPRSATAVSLVATDGGNNSLRFDPFMVQVVRVVDSNDNELCLEVVTPTTPIFELDARQFGPDGSPTTPLGRLMSALNVFSLEKLSHFIRVDDEGFALGGVKALIIKKLPKTVADPNQVSFDLIIPTLEAILGGQDTEWHTFKAKTGKTWAKTGPKRH